MAIAFVAKGTTAKVDTTVSGPNVAVSLPAGHVSGHLLLMFATTDDNTNTISDPSGWTRLFYITNGTSVGTPYTPRMRTKCYYRIDNGSLGSSVTLNFDTGHPWPTANPSVLAFCEAYSGCDITGPIENWSFSSTTSTAVGMNHPTMTTVAANAWLISFRAVSSDSPGATFTISGGTNTERQDDIDSINELACATYDAGPLTAGLQTQRVTTASRAATYGGLAASIVIKPASAANAVFATPGTASISMTAKNASTSATNGPWDLCAAGGLPTYSYAVDWDGDGSYADLGDEVTGDVVTDVSITYGRDQDRQLNPASVGNASFSLCNASRSYSPEYALSPLYGNLAPARPMRAQITWSGNTYPLFVGRIDDYTIKADFSDRNVDFTFLDGLNDLSEVKLSTAVYSSMRTGELINTILDLVGWTGGRDIDSGATIVKYWWAEGTDAFSAINDLVASEGPPAIAFVAPDGTFVFHDRHHRLQNAQSTSSQATFAEKALGDCAAPAVTGFHFTPPFTYAHGWRDIVNSVDFSVEERQQDDELTPVFSTEDTINLSTGESYEITFSGNDPFVNAVTPVSGTDYTTVGAGVLNVTLSRTSGASAKVTLLAVGGTVNVQTLQVRANAIPVKRTIKVHREDSSSITTHGERSYPGSAPWANANDADAIASMVLLRYSQRRPTVDLRVVTSDPVHFVQVITRTVGDRIHIINGEMGIDDDFFIERVTHTIQRVNSPGQPPVHGAIFGCEKAATQSTNPFRFDVRGAGFDQGIFDPIAADDATSVFIFDHPTQGVFDVGLYGT
jgi:hypothetical protein